jgi:hypothetical protein
MMKAAAVLCALLSAVALALDDDGAAHAAKIYKWTDAQGNVIYSDTPRPGAIEMDIPTEPAGIVPVPPQEPTKPGEGTAQPAAGYDALTVRSPAEGQVLENPGGWVNVSLAVTPALRTAEGHAIRLRLDGQTLAARYPGSEIAIPDVQRGEHMLEAEVVDRAGAVLITSAVVTFTVHEASSQAPEGPEIYPPATPGQPYPPVYSPVYPPQRPRPAPR